MGPNMEERRAEMFQAFESLKLTPESVEPRRMTLVGLSRTRPILRDETPRF